MPRKQPTTSLAQVNSVTKMEPRCNICKDQAVRTKVDKLIAAQFTNSSIAEELIETHKDFADKNFDTVRKNVERHAKAHVDIRSKAIRQIVERRAKEQGILVEEETGKLVSGRALLDLIVVKGTEQASNPDSKVRYADALEAVRMLEDVQRQEYLAELERMQRQVYAISQAVKELVPESMLPQLIGRAEDIFNNDKAVLETT